MLKTGIYLTIFNVDDVTSARFMMGHIFKNYEKNLQIPSLILQIFI